MSDVHAVQDETLSSAADHMPDIDALEVENGDREANNRDDLGRFKSTQEEAGREAANDDDEQPVKTDDDAGKESEPEDDEDYIEWELPPAAEGEEPVTERRKASEVLEGFQRAQQLEQEVANLKETAPPPPDYDRAISESINQAMEYRNNLAQQQGQMEMLLQALAPDPELGNQHSERYDPDAYIAQQQYQGSLHSRLQQLQQERARVEHEANQQQEIRNNIMLQAEYGKLIKMMPELKEETHQRAFADDVSRHYGIDQATLNSVHDSRFYALAKDALAYRKQSAAKETAVKAVKARPKLVKGKARSTNPANRRSAEGMQRLQQSGSLEDAMSALPDDLF